MGSPAQGAEERLTLAVDVAEIARAGAWAREVAARLAVPASALFAVDLCLEEALSNTIRYGFTDPPPENAVLRLTFAREASALRVTIDDNAAPFDPCAAADPAMPTDLATANVGGLGIHLMRNFTESMVYERVDGLNRLTLRFTIDADA
jgi:anti-sigma regulatory factor (Ser/Thr protein kinase)